MVLLPKITEDAIVENLKKRYMDDYIFVSLPVCLEFCAEYVFWYYAVRSFSLCYFNSGMIIK